MTDLLAAASKQIKYAGNEFASGDTAKGQEHLDKALSFIQRAAGSTAEAPVADSDAPLSDDMAEAAQQLLARYGLDNTASGAEIVAASPDKGRLAAVVGLLGQPGAIPDADYSLFEEGYEPSSPPDEENGLQSWAPKTEWAASGSFWKHVNAGGI